MAKKKNPLLEMEARKQEQEKLVKMAMGEETTEKKTRLTVSISEEDLETVKILAAKNKMNMSALIHSWIVEKKLEAEN